MGLGHVGEQKGTDYYSPSNYHHPMNHLEMANPNLVAFTNDDVYDMELRNAGGSFYMNPNNGGYSEIVNSLSVDAAGLPLQTSFHWDDLIGADSYQDILDPPSGFGNDDQFAPDDFIPAPTSLPPAEQGILGTTTPSDVFQTLRDGFNAFRTSQLGIIVEELDLVDLPLVDSHLATMLDLSNAVESFVSSITSSSSISSMQDIQSALEGQGFSIEHLVEDLSTLPTNSPADLLRITQTYYIDTLSTTSPLDPAAINTIGDLSDLNLSGNLEVGSDAYITLTFGVDTGGFYLVPGEVLTLPTTVTGALSANSPSAFGVTANAYVGIDPRVSLATTASDGRLRSGFSVGTSASVQLKGSAASKPTFISTIPFWETCWRPGAGYGISQKTRKVTR